MNDTHKHRGFSKSLVLVALLALLVLSCGVVSFAQTISRETGTVSTASAMNEAAPTVTMDASSLHSNVEQQNVQASQSSSSSKPGTIIGTVLDQSGTASAGAVVRLTPGDSSAYHEVVSGDNGQYSFPNVPAGHFQLSIKSTGFGNEMYSGDLQPGQTFLVPPIVLSVATVVTEVKVTVDPVEVATEQVHEQEQQRVLGFIPNFYVTYYPDAPPLTTRLKFQLAWKSSTDPITIAGAAFLAGLQQAGDQYPEFGQGMEGYGKRLGAAYADVVTSTYLSGAIFPALLKQDPRYFYKGTGSKKSRILYAIANSVICKGDNGNWQGNYSNIAGIFAGAAISSTYYPNKNQGSVILSNGFVRLGESSIAGVFQEFVARKLTKPPKKKTSASANPGDAGTVQSK